MIIQKSIIREHEQQQCAEQPSFCIYKLQSKVPPPPGRIDGGAHHCVCAAWLSQKVCARAPPIVLLHISLSFCAPPSLWLLTGTFRNSSRPQDFLSTTTIEAYIAYRHPLHWNLINRSNPQIICCSPDTYVRDDPYSKDLLLTIITHIHKWKRGSIYIPGGVAGAKGRRF